MLNKPTQKRATTGLKPLERIKFTASPNLTLNMGPLCSQLGVVRALLWFARNGVSSERGLPETKMRLLLTQCVRGLTILFRRRHITSTAARFSDPLFTRIIRAQQPSCFFLHVILHTMDYRLFIVDQKIGSA